jgi:hypothetical protein
VKLCALLVLLYAPDANAWGLQTHVFLAHYALAAVPLAEPEWRAAAQALPRFVLAGACLPDLAIVGRFFLHSPAFCRSHLWATLRRIAASPRSTRDRALALGYATHLVSDVVAHNDFVPEHEARIGRTAMIGHLMSEWAMDHWLQQKLRPAEALEEVGEHAVQFVACGFRCSETLARRALDVLMRGDRVLRASPAPMLCRALVAMLMRRCERRFGVYMARTTQVLGAVETALAGGFEDWSGLDPEGCQGDGGADRRAGQHVARIMQAQHHARSRGEHGERDQDDRKIRVVRAGHERERDRVKRVA